jgi:hypothetical protein
MPTFRHLVGCRANRMSRLCELPPISDNNLKIAKSGAMRGQRSLEKGGACHFAK